jgi:hypothetical protein
MRADRVASHLLYYTNAASFLDANVGAPILQQA